MRLRPDRRKIRQIEAIERGEAAIEKRERWYASNPLDKDEDGAKFAKERIATLARLRGLNDHRRRVIGQNPSYGR